MAALLTCTQHLLTKSTIDLYPHQLVNLGHTTVIQEECPDTAMSIEVEAIIEVGVVEVTTEVEVAAMVEMIILVSVVDKHY